MSNRRPTIPLVNTRSTAFATLLPTIPLRARVWRAVKQTAAYVARRRGEAALYQLLSKLSDAELERHRIGRGDLHRHMRGSSGHWWAS
jgi:hypothetical protein